MFEKTTSFSLMAIDEQVKTAVEVVDRVDYDELARRVPRGSDYLTIVVRAVSAGDYWGPNNNHDYFSEEELLSAYSTFMDAHVFKNHANKDVARAIGAVFDSLYDRTMHYVALAIGVDRTADPDTANGVAKGYLTDVSMGCKVRYVSCPLCGKIAYRPEERCDHLLQMKGKIVDGQLIYEINHGVRFHDISLVLNGADKTAKILTTLGKTASMNKTASWRGAVKAAYHAKSADFDKQVPSTGPYVLDVDSEVDRAALGAHLADRAEADGRTALRLLIRHRPMPDGLLDAVRGTWLSRGVEPHLPSFFLPATSLLHGCDIVPTPREWTRLFLGPSVQLDGASDPSFWLDPVKVDAQGALGEAAAIGRLLGRIPVPLLPRVRQRMSCLPDLAELLYPLIALRDAEAFTESGEDPDFARNWRIGNPNVAKIYRLTITICPAAGMPGSGLPDALAYADERDGLEKQAAPIYTRTKALLLGTPVIYAASGYANEKRNRGEALSAPEAAAASAPGLLSLLNVVYGPSVGRFAEDMVTPLLSASRNEAARLFKATAAERTEMRKVAELDPRTSLMLQAFRKAAAGDARGAREAAAEASLDREAMASELVRYGVKVAAVLKDYLAMVGGNLVGAKNPVREMVTGGAYTVDGLLVSSLLGAGLAGSQRLDRAKKPDGVSR